MKAKRPVKRLSFLKITMWETGTHKSYYRKNLCCLETSISELFGFWNYCRCRANLKIQNNSNNDKILLWGEEAGPKYPAANDSEDSSMNQKLFLAWYVGQEKKQCSNCIEYIHTCTHAFTHTCFFGTHELRYRSTMRPEIRKSFLKSKRKK